VSLLLFALFILFVVMGVPIVVAIGAGTMVALEQSGTPLLVVPQQMFQGINSLASSPYRCSFSSATSCRRGR
jgi:C4-dicarboxylate transporter, DctM subunit